jgi:AAA domain/DnaB-like helicase N terminal domain
MSNGSNGRGSRVPPADLEAESSVLGAMLISGDAASTAMRLVRPEQFYKPQHQAVFAAAVECFRAGEGVDVVTVAHRLDRTGMLESVGGKDALMELQAFPGAISNVGRYIAIVTEASERRGIIRAASNIAEAAFDWGRPLARVYELMSPPADVNIGNRYEGLSMSTTDLLALPPPTWLVHGLVPRGGLAVTYGPPKSAKTFLTLHEALCVATGMRFFSDVVQRGKVLYIAAEGMRALGQRVQAWCMHFDHDPAALAGWITFLGVPVPLADPGAVAELRVYIEELGVILVVIDTLARCMVGGDENSSRDMTLAVGAMEELRSTGATVHAVHHTGKQIEAGMRGHSSLLGAVDTAIEVLGDRKAFKVTVTAQKDGLTGEPWWGKLVPVASSVVINQTARPEDDAEVSRESFAEAISELLAKNPEVAYSGRDVTDAIKGKDVDIRAALKWLVTEGYVRAEKRKGSSGAVDHFHFRPYVRPAPVVESDDEPF